MKTCFHRLFLTYPALQSQLPYGGEGDVLFVLEFLVSGGLVLGCYTGVKWYVEAGADLGSGQDS